MDKHLCTLTDAECPIDQLLAALNSLTLILQENESVAPVLMFDRGAVTIILNLMNTFPTSAEIAVKSAVILEYMAQRNHLTLSSIHKQNGILTLLSAIQVAFKGGQQATAEALTMAGPSRTSSKRGKKNGPIAGSRSNSRNNLVRAPSMGSNTSLASVNILNEESPRGSHSQTSVPSGFSTLPVGSYRTVDANSEVEQGESLMEGLLQKYFDPRFKSQMEKMDKTTRAEIIKHLLTLFEKIDRLLSVSGLISLDIDLDEAIDQIVGEAGQMLQSELILLYLVDPESGELIATEYDPFVDAKEREMIERLRFPAGTGIVGWVAETEDFVNVKDASNHDRFNPVIDTRCEGEVLEANSILCVPIKNRDGVLKGVLQAVNKIGANGSIQPFNHEDEFLLRTLGRQSGLIIQNGQIYAQTKRTQKKVDILLETTRSLGSTLQLDVLVKMIMEAAKELLAADRCTIFLADEKKKYLTTHIQGRDFVQEIRIPINTGIAGYVFSSGNSVNIHDAYKDSRFNPEVDRQTGYVTRNILCVPIKNKNGESIGVTQMINRKSGSFDADDEKMLISFSAQAAVTIEKTYLFKKLEDTLRETSQMKNYLFMILQSITNVVITLDGDGCLSHINHPSKMDMEPMLQQMKSSHYKEWLGDENATLVADIQRAYTTAGGTIFAQDYELHIQGKIRNVNYTIVQMTSETQLSRDKHNAGVVIVLEDISSEKRAMMTLGRYMSPALAKQVMAEDGGQLGGKRKKVAILFSDIRSFTTLSESMEPHEVVELLNHHFSDAVNAIMSEQGILDKYIGDAVMAVFGVPFVSPDDSIHACNAALRMKESLVIFNEARAKAGLIQIKIGIGVNTGMVLSGNIGSTKRMEFSCIGDAVNLASRIEGLTKYYNMTILVSEFTLQETGNHFVTREVDQVVVTGKSKQVGIYELLGRVDDPIPDTVMQGVELYRQGLALYRQRKFSEAIEVFTRAINEVDDGPSKTMRTRCKKYIEDPPAPGWNGVYISDSK
ncbi:hypothetical protein DFJ73DRAFT_860793 [Zopfochytrium polystomum]|nr:hypothetical protein DFJ73DRAFT_860793 [Zopfochytrium polystomum]